MTLVSIAATLVATASLGAWLGAMTFFSFVTAPTVFDVLEREQAGSVVNAVFPTYYEVGVALGTAGLAATLVRGSVSSFDIALVAVLGLATVAVATASYARWLLIPKMEAAGPDAFEQYHGRSVALNGVAMLAVAAALLAAHV